MAQSDTLVAEPPTYDSVVLSRSTMSDAIPPPSPDDDVAIQVSDPTKVGDGLSSFWAYNVLTRVPPGPLTHHFGRSESIVWRRFRDFRWLREALAKEQKGVVLPPLPERNLVASKIQTSTKFLESRRKALAVFLVRVVAHPSLRTADSLRAFLTQSDQEWAFTLARSNTKPTTATELLEKAGSMFGLLNHKAANLVQGKRDDAAEDPEYLRFRDFINILEAHTNELHKHAARLAQKTESSGSVLHRLRDATTGLAQFEKEPLVAALQHVSRACDTVGTQRTSEGQRLENGLACTLKEAVRGLREVKHTMEARSRTLTRVARAVGELEARQGRVARLRAVPGTTADKITLADRDVQVAEAEVASARSEYEGIVGGMGAELPRFQMERSEELRRALRAFVVGQKEAAEEQARTWTEALRVLDQPLGVEGSPT